MCSVLIPCETISNTIVLVLGLDGDFHLGVKGLLLVNKEKKSVGILSY